MAAESKAAGASAAVRPAAVAGSFYPAEAARLSADIDEFLEQSAEEPIGPGFPKIIIVPHAGYIYSGAVAAQAWDRLRPGRGIINRVVILGPCHRVAVGGMALPGVAAMDTPLGRLRVDTAAADLLRDLPDTLDWPAAHAREHSLEVQLPFVQRVLGDVAVLPVVVGDAAPETVAQAIERLWGGDETVFVISTDLSHFHTYDEARAIDGATVNAILGFDTSINHLQACGATPVAGALIAARRHGMAPALLDVCNSGDTAGGRDQVVGYASFAIPACDALYGEEHGRVLLGLARASIGVALGLNEVPSLPPYPWLEEQRASFVTLTLDGELRGCIGSLEAHRALGADIVSNAQSAAFRDPRFPAVSADEFRRLEVEVSMLSRAKRLEFENEADLIRQLVPGRDGLILERGEGRGARRGTFLPQVWESLPDPVQFLAHLRQKAGVAADARIESCRIKRYRVAKFQEHAGRVVKESDLMKPH